MSEHWIDTTGSKIGDADEAHEARKREIEGCLRTAESEGDIAYVRAQLQAEASASEDGEAHRREFAWHYQRLDELEGQIFRPDGVATA